MALALRFLGLVGQAERLVPHREEPREHDGVDDSHQRADLPAVHQEFHAAGGQLLEPRVSRIKGTCIPVRREFERQKNAENKMTTAYSIGQTFRSGLLWYPSISRGYVRTASLCRSYQYVGTWYDTASSRFHDR